MNFLNGPFSAVASPPPRRSVLVREKNRGNLFQSATSSGDFSFLQIRILSHTKKISFHILLDFVFRLLRMSKCPPVFLSWRSADARQKRCLRGLRTPALRLRPRRAGPERRQRPAGDHLRRRRAGLFFQRMQPKSKASVLLIDSLTKAGRIFTNCC